MFTGVNVYETWDCILPNDPDKENPTIFKMGILDARLTAYIKDRTASYDANGGVRINVGERQLLKVKFGLKGLVNFIDPRTGKPLEKFDTVSMSVNGKNYDVVTDEILNMLSALMEPVSMEIDKKNSLDEEEIKN